MAQAANTILQQTINGIAQGIANFFVGNSPPPEGPLSTIDQGGANVAQAWADGFGSGMGDVFTMADSVRATFDKLGTTMTLQDGRAAMQAATGDLDAMTAAADETDAQIKQLDHELAALDDQAFAIQRQLDDITQSVSGTD